jgi:hypothetical protein
MHPIRLNPITLGINLHLRHHIIILHILLANLTAILNSLDAFLQVVGSDGAACDGGFRDEEDRGLGDEGREHGARDYGLYGGDGGVGVTLVDVNIWKGGKSKEGLPFVHRKSNRS